MISTTYTVGDEWWIERTDENGEQRYPATIEVGGGNVDDTRRYVPERTCRMEYNPVHCDYVCSSCGEWHNTGMYDACDADDMVLLRPYRYCPNCGAKVVEE